MYVETLVRLCELPHCRFRTGDRTDQLRRQAFGKCRRSRDRVLELEAHDISLAVCRMDSDESEGDKGQHKKTETACREQHAFCCQVGLITTSPCNEAKFLRMFLIRFTTYIRRKANCFPSMHRIPLNLSVYLQSVGFAPSLSVFSRMLTSGDQSPVHNKRPIAAVRTEKVQLAYVVTSW